jgi:hypothetical protein
MTHADDALHHETVSRTHSGSKSFLLLIFKKEGLPSFRPVQP